MTVRADELVGKAVMALVLNEPFYGHVVGAMNRSVTEDVPTAAVTIRNGRPTLLVNAGFFTGLRRADERTAVVKHEVLHVLFGHLTRGLRRDWDPHVANLAADLVVNQHIGKWSLPAGAITLASFPDLDLPRDATLERYYALLLPHRDALPAASSHSDHRCWGAASEDDAILADMEIARIAGHAKERAPAAYGLLPGVLRERVEALLQARTPTLDWRRVLRLFGESSRRTRIQATLRRPSKRYGTLPGIRVRRFQRVVVAVDTSGSVPTEALVAFFAEIHGIWRQGAVVTVVECDAAIQATWTYEGRAPTDVHGRGGTAFDPVFTWVAEQRERPDAVIYLTDGGAPAPRVPIHTPLLWVVVGGTGTHLKPGRVVRLR